MPTFALIGDVGEIGDVDVDDHVGESFARTCRPAAGRAAFITHTNECIMGRATNLHREHKRLKRPDTGWLCFGTHGDTILVAGGVDVL